MGDEGPRRGQAIWQSRIRRAWVWPIHPQTVYNQPKVFADEAHAPWPHGLRPLPDRDSAPGPRPLRGVPARGLSGGAPGLRLDAARGGRPHPGPRSPSGRRGAGRRGRAAGGGAAGAAHARRLPHNRDSHEWSFLAYRTRPVIRPRAVLAMGTMRRQEALAATAALGVPARDVSFLGYPDHGTLAIWRDHWGARPPDRGRLTRATAVPYATAYRPGAPFKGEEILADLEAILRDFRPTRIFVSHPADRHPDHAALYLFTRVALWDLQGQVAATVHPFLVHYPGWPAEKGFHPGEELAPPPKLLAGFRWQTRELTGADVDAKRQALAAHHTQYGYSASRLLPFVRGNELYGDVDVPTLAPGGDAIHLQDLTVRLVKDQLEIAANPPQPLQDKS